MVYLTVYPGYSQVLLSWYSTDWYCGSYGSWQVNAHLSSVSYSWESWWTNCCRWCWYRYNRTPGPAVTSYNHSTGECGISAKIHRSYKKRRKRPRWWSGVTKTIISEEFLTFLSFNMNFVLLQDPVLFSGSLRRNLDPFNHHTDEKLWHALEVAHLKNFVTGLENGLQFTILDGGENLR